MSEEKKDGGGGCGCGAFSLGGFIALLMSWSVNHSVVYAFLHGILGWFYVVYWLLVHGGKSGPIPW